MEVDFLKENSIENIIEKIPKNYDIVVLTELLSKSKSIEIDEICRKNNIPFIYTAVLGLTGFIFSDFGKEHKITEKSNKELKKYMIKNITKETNGICEIIKNDKNPGLFNEKFVIFKNIEGMKELNFENLKRETKIKYKTKTSFYIGDTSKFSEYIKGGYVQEVVLPEIKNYKSLKERLEKPYDYYLATEEELCDEQNKNIKEDNTFLDCDNSENIGKNEILFITFKIIMDFYEKNNRLPELNNSEEANEITQQTFELYNALKK